MSGKDPVASSVAGDAERDGREEAHSLVQTGVDEDSRLGFGGALALPNCWVDDAKGLTLAALSNRSCAMDALDEFQGYASYTSP